MTWLCTAHIVIPYAAAVYSLTIPHSLTPPRHSAHSTVHPHSPHGTKTLGIYSQRSSRHRSHQPFPFTSSQPKYHTSMHLPSYFMTDAPPNASSTRCTWRVARHWAAPPAPTPPCTTAALRPTTTAGAWRGGAPRSCWTGSWPQSTTATVRGSLAWLLRKQRRGCRWWDMCMQLVCCWHGCCDYTRHGMCGRLFSTGVRNRRGCCARYKVNWHGDWWDCAPSGMCRCQPDLFSTLVPSFIICIVSCTHRPGTLPRPGWHHAGGAAPLRQVRVPCLAMRL